MKLEKRNSRSGFTLLEVLIGAVILMGVFGSMFALQLSSMDAFRRSSNIGVMREKALQALELVASEARWARPDTLLITQQNGSDRVDFSTPVGFAGGATLWSTPITFRIDPSNIDANRNGVMDDGRLVRIQDGVTRILSNYVPAGGFSFQRAGNIVTLTLQLSKTGDDPNEISIANAQTSVTLRN